MFTVVVPGTGYSEKDWSDDGSAGNFINSVGETFGETPVVINNKDFWSGGDNPGARERAANHVVNLINNHDFAEGEQLNIVGHSHGGNIANLVSQMTERRIDTLVTLGTPTSGDYQPNYDRIGQHVNAYSNKDFVQKFGGTQTSVSEVLGRVAFGNFGRWLGAKLSIGQFGWGGRQYSKASNYNATGDTSFIGAHSDLWRNENVWNNISNRIR
ncbi:MAG: hypothetical protein COU90_04795 [Candidatus Ryanbacteria bacterium CG10_big_fil_rev_8_21_14_0_10_43_42]|uniref:GPI inositol-deacylase PGAP1-like alpha/beta domain-containing protein n=1 Tax=Candidatus Ryanbacteria bacterium CG10_big_fil_rev_8_21_14_0_10_43_42 TaxID=1974864 RepID=A0A2M8KW63_9BACT|nr:MAG: hypothetical protein COU90_04795 [Candidatus Ryanbacteria bacterium CG10_big_fil_rev_8_21_14_0_10_43_42]